MNENNVTAVLKKHRSIRVYRDIDIKDDIIHDIIKSGQQAAFASQSYSILMQRDMEKNPFHAPLLFYMCVDIHKFELIMAKRKWDRKMCDLFAFLLSMEDASYAAQNMVIAAESLGLGTCYLGYVPYYASAIKKQFELPDKVFPIVGITMGYADEEPDKRPRYPIDFTLFEGKYPEFSDEDIERAMVKMDEGYLKQDYYLKDKIMIKLEGDRKERYTYDDYSWTEHISRKMGQWSQDPEELFKQMELCGFDLKHGPFVNQ